MQREAARNQEEMKEEEVMDLAEFYRLKKQRFEGAAGGTAKGGETGGSQHGVTGGGRGSVAAASRIASASGGGSSSDEEGLPAAGKATARKAADLASMPPPPPKAPTTAKPVFKVVAKPKAVEPLPSAVSSKQAEVGLSGLLGGYGSSDSDSQ